MWTLPPQLGVQASTWLSVVGNRRGEVTYLRWQPGCGSPQVPWLGRWRGAPQAGGSVPTGGRLNLASALPPEGEGLSHRPGAS